MHAIGTSRRLLSSVALALLAMCVCAGCAGESGSVIDGRACDDNYYEGACIDPAGGDVDCEGGSGDGPQYVGQVEVVGNDWADLDRDGDGTACDWG